MRMHWGGFFHRRSKPSPRRPAVGCLLHLEPLEPRELLSTASTAFPDAVSPHNVILMIGDGMGAAHVEAARMFVGGSIAFDQLPYRAQMATYSANSSITDSAASATAMATGQKVNNRVISLAIPGSGAELPTSLELSSSMGKATGLVTTSTITDATPAAFAAHVVDRADTAGVAIDMLTNSRPHVLLGGGGAGMSPQAAINAGYQVVTDRAGMFAVDTTTIRHLSGQFGSDVLPYEYDRLSDPSLNSMPHLNEMTSTALAILDHDPDGFFLVVEGGLIDRAAHENHIQRNVRETVEFAHTVQVVLDWAAGRTDTLVIVTADHETGGLRILQNNGPGQVPTVSWTTNGHTGVNVPVYAWGAGAQRVGGILDNTSLLRLSMASQPLGMVDFLDLPQQNPAARDLWYEATATRSGLLTLEAMASPGLGNSALHLYDDNYRLLTTSRAVASGQRIDWPALANQTFFIRLSGANSEVEFRLANLLQIDHAASRATLFGTASSDLFEAALVSSPFDVAVNGVRYRASYFPSINNVRIVGGGGSDSLTITGSRSDETVTLRPGSAFLSSSGCTVEIGNVRSITILGGGGSDTATFYDSPADDIWLTTPTYAGLSASHYDNQVRFFSSVEAQSTAGGVDVAKFYDSPGDDLFVATPTYAALIGTGFSNRAKFFGAVHAFATAEGLDTAKFYDSPDDDTFYGDPIQASLFRAGQYYNRVKFFEAVHAFATAGGVDVARLFDSPGSDKFYADPQQSALWSASYYNRVKFFERVYANATAGGHDEANLYDSPAVDLLEADGNWVRVSNQAADFLYEASGFDFARATATTPGDTKRIPLTHPLLFALDLIGPWQA